MSSQNKLFKTYFFEAMEYLRCQEKISYKELAGRAKINYQYLSDLKRGKRNPKEETQEKIAKAFDFKLTDFLDIGRRIVAGENPNSPPPPMVADNSALAPAAASGAEDLSGKERELLRTIVDMAKRLLTKDEQIKAMADRIGELNAKWETLSAGRPLPAAGEASTLPAVNSAPLPLPPTVRDLAVTKGLTPEQVQLMHDFRDLLLENGVEADMLVTLLEKWAAKKRAGQDPEVHTKKTS